MDKKYFLNAGIPPPLHLDPSPSAMPTWQPLTPAPELNFSPEQPSNCFPNRGWEKSTEQYAHFESALSSLVSSPGASNSALSGDGYAIRELIGKLGSICNAGEISPPLLAATNYIGGGNGSANTSCYTTPMNSPPKLNIPIMDRFLEENLTNFRTSALPAVSADPGFAERAAKFSCFGSRSFNGRTSQFGVNNAEFKYRPSNPLMGNGNLPRVSSSPSLKASMGGQENNNSAQTQMEMCSSNAPVSVPDKKFSRFSASAANSNEDSSVSEQIPNDLNSRKRKAVSKGKANATKEADADEDLNTKRSKQTESRGNKIGDAKTEEETADEDQKVAKTSPKPPEPPKDYIHVRARRGQATDSHSLAERVRREKISERMKLLQDLVPGCNKVTGKALMLDEIINYVQSLQRQVEFLSMKLASVNPRMDFNVDSLLSKDIYQPNGTLPHPNYPLDSSASALYDHHPHQNPLVHTNISSGAMSQGTVDPLDATHCCNVGLQIPSVDGFGEGLPQFPTFCEDDLQSIVQMAFGENRNRDTDFQSQGFPAQNQTPHMKIEL